MNLGEWMNTVRTSCWRNRKYNKVPNRSHSTEEYSSWTEKNTLEGFNSRLGEAEERISELKDKAGELTQSEEQKEKKKKKKGWTKSKDSVRDLWDNTKQATFLYIRGIPEGE